MDDAKPIRVLIADDHAILRDGLRRLLESEPGLQVIGEAGDGDEALRLVEALRPDVLLLDVAMPRQNGLETLQKLGPRLGSPRTILLTADIEDEQVVKAWTLGAWGVARKHMAPATLIEAIRTVASGQLWTEGRSVSPPAASPADARGRTPRFNLTPRERQVVGAIVAGCSNREIAGRFALSEQTVKHHLTRIFTKCGVTSRLELAMIAVRERLGDDA